MFNSSGLRIFDKSSHKYSLLMVLNAFVISSRKMWVEYTQNVIAFSHSIFILKTCSVVLFPFYMLHATKVSLNQFFSDILSLKHVANSLLCIDN